MRCNRLSYLVSSGMPSLCFDAISATNLENTVVVQVFVYLTGHRSKMTTIVSPMFPEFPGGLPKTCEPNRTEPNRTTAQNQTCEPNRTEPNTELNLRTGPNLNL